MTDPRLLRARWLGTVPYQDADVLQRALHTHAADDYLLLLEHPHVYTLGSSATLEHVLVPPASVGAELVRADRGGDVTYHGPGQLVGYPIVSLEEWRAGQRDVVAYIRRLEGVLADALADLGVGASCVDGYTGVWVGDEKIAAIGVRVSRGRTRHGFALNVDPDLSMFGHIVPCGIRDKGVTSVSRLLGRRVEMRDVVDRIVDHFARRFGHAGVDRQDVVWRETPADLSPFTRAAMETPGGDGGDGARAGEAPAPVRLLGRLAEAGVHPEGQASAPRPEWMRVKARMGAEFVELKRLTRGLELHTVCEEAGCPNIYECWGDRTATFMILGDRCTRACGFCLVDTRRPSAVDEEEPQRVAGAVRTLGLAHAVITCVARDDLPDGGASAFAATIRAVREASPRTQVEVLVSDCKGDPESLATVFEARPDVFGHNLETVARLHRAARPSAAYARSLAVLARASDAGLVTKSGVMVGLGETDAEIRAAMADLRSVGVELLTIGQYLRPSSRHLPVVRWWHPDEFAALRDHAERLGFAHVAAGPLVRSSYHAREGAERAVAVRAPTVREA